MPYLFKLKISDKKYIVVHAGYIETNKLQQTNYSSVEDFYLYARDEVYNYGSANSIVISGHTPTISKTNIAYNNGLVYKRKDNNGQCIFYNIDCGCAYKPTHSNAHLACIRLNDEKIFYI